MGYMSTNMFTTDEKGFDRLLELICECGSEQWDAKCCDCQFSGTCTMLPKFDVEKHVGGGVVFGYEWKKWYACQFDMFHAAWKRFISEEFPWTHVRIGEENGDISEEEGGDTDKDGFPFVTVQIGWDYDVYC